jgi:hypothetical protein
VVRDPHTSFDMPERGYEARLKRVESCFSQIQREAGRPASSYPSALETDGFVVFRGLWADAMSLEVADQLGIIDKVEGLATVQTLIPRKVSSSPPNTYSGNFGHAEFPLHTDLAHWALPPRYLLLRCIRALKMSQPRS